MSKLEDILGTIGKMDPTGATALIQGGGALLSGIAGGIGARRQARRQEERAEEALGMASELQESALAAREQAYGMPPSYADLRKLVNQDPTSDYLRQQALRQEAGQLQALAGGGARALLGGTQALARGTADTMARIAAGEQQRRTEGLQVLGSAEQRMQEQRLIDARTDLNLGRQLQAEALGAQAGAEELNAAASQGMFQAGVQGLKGVGMSALDFDNADPELFKAFYGNNYDKGGLLRGKTPGEFSHDINPIDIMQDGAKIGEMTGGEGIVSPEDLGKLEQLAGSGKTSLHKFVRGLIRKLEKNSNG